MPLPPDQRRLQRTISAARMDGWSLVGLSSPAALYGIVSGAPTIALIGLGIALCGGLELCAAGRLKRGDARGLWVLPTLQLVVLALVLNYAWLRWHHADGAQVLKLLPAFSRAQLDEALPDPAMQAELLTLTFRIVAFAIGAGAVFYQGGFALWYRLGFGAIRRALGASSGSTIPAKSGADIS